MNGVTLPYVAHSIITRALALLPSNMDTKKARVPLFAFGYQESKYLVRKQYGNGPARGFWQFERGTAASRGGVWGLYIHPVSKPLLQDVCAKLNVPFAPQQIWEHLEINDVLAAAVARIALWVDKSPLPEVGDVMGTWDLYLRTWRPGKPRFAEWHESYEMAEKYVLSKA